MGEHFDVLILGADISGVDAAYHSQQYCPDKSFAFLERQESLGDTDETATFTYEFLWMCQGYYRYQKGYTPAITGLDRFLGLVAHPQTWPEGLDHKGKRVVVIGSGTTAATIVPALPLFDPENFNAGYLTRMMHIMPKQGDWEPWIFS
jgi:cation diffusion facilitator CzcD-associated flavoprotein CzcO